VRVDGAAGLAKIGKCDETKIVVFEIQVDAGRVKVESSESGGINYRRCLT
jgi:hypothetical protein